MLNALSIELVAIVLLQHQAEETNSSRSCIGTCTVRHSVLSFRHQAQYYPTVANSDLNNRNTRFTDV